MADMSQQVEEYEKSKKQYEDYEKYKTYEKYKKGYFEVELPRPLLYGHIEMAYHEEGEPSSRIVDIKDDLLIDVKWCIEGSLVPYICGHWCVEVFLECYGDCSADFRKKVPLIELDPCGDGCYKTTVELKGGTIKFNQPDCSCVCKFVVTVTYLTECKDKRGYYMPGAIAGVVEGPILQFYDMGEKVVD